MNTELIKNKILDLAIKGKLVEQRPEEGTAEELYAQIQEEKKKLIAEGKLKKEMSLPDITDEEIPFEIPESWKWVRIGDIEEINLGFTYTPQYVDDGIIFLSVKDISSGNIDFSNAKKVSKDTYENAAYGSKPQKGDILFGRVGTIGKPQIVETDIPFCIFVSLGFFRDHTNIIEKKYIADWMNSAFFFKQVGENVKGSTIKNLNTSWLKNFYIPLPPLAEQKRIVAKIDEIFSRIEVIEKAKADLAREGNLLEKKILDLAIRGKLVEQRPEEGSAEELYAQIQEEKQKLISEGKIKKEKHLPEITVEEIPFEIPESWKWVKLGSISSYAQTKEKVTTKSIEPEQWSLDLEDIEKETGRILTILKVKDRPIKGEKTCFKKGDILYSKLRPYLKKILIAPDTGICSSEIVPFDTYFGVNNFYLLYVLKSTFVDAIVNSATYGVKMPRAGTDTMINLLIPLPPLSEQKRIVAKIEEIKKYCEMLK